MLDMVATDLQKEEKNMQDELVKNSRATQDLKDAKQNEKKSKMQVVNADGKESQLNNEKDDLRKYI